eukprot:CAMPEP_0117571142 /NCGR_PEP_ID=MMETSP0784-20121206/59582_1 /TAXON_ID=39447 /ORGANISM="" /LENGTH=330 /DNA_ID=CAMNT_0005369259 /DNA_START=110 /DNA_END=1100 /DNA_ORIENTATION=+
MVVIKMLRCASRARSASCRPTHPLQSLVLEAVFTTRQIGKFAYGDNAQPSLLQTVEHNRQGRKAPLSETFLRHVEQDDRAMVRPTRQESADPLAVLHHWARCVSVTHGVGELPTREDRLHALRVLAMRRTEPSHSLLGPGGALQTEDMLTASVHGRPKVLGGIFMVWAIDRAMVPQLMPLLEQVHEVILVPRHALPYQHEGCVCTTLAQHIRNVRDSGICRSEPAWRVVEAECDVAANPWEFLDIEKAKRRVPQRRRTEELDRAAPEGRLHRALTTTIVSSAIAKAAPRARRLCTTAAALVPAQRLASLVRFQNDHYVVDVVARESYRRA